MKNTQHILHFALTHCMYSNNIASFHCINQAAINAWYVITWHHLHKKPIDWNKCRKFQVVKNVLGYLQRRKEMLWSRNQMLKERYERAASSTKGLLRLQVGQRYETAASSMEGLLHLQVGQRYGKAASSMKEFLHLQVGQRYGKAASSTRKLFHLQIGQRFG